MNKYSVITKCIKCGCETADSRHYATGLIVEHYIQRTCTNCRYKWDELPLDYKEDT